MKIVKNYFSNLFPNLEYMKNKNIKTFKRAVLFYYNRSLNLFEI